MTREVRDSDGSVGYGRPPIQSRFKPGQSGNPRGRPKRSMNVDTILDKVLGQRVVVNENGKRRTLSKLEVALEQQANKAGRGQHQELCRADEAADQQEGQHHRKTIRPLARR